MRAGRILKKLKEQGFTFQFIGSPEDDVCMVQRYDESVCLDEATLYACEAACRPHFTQSPARVFPCLLAKDSFDCGKILQAVSQILRDERREEMNFLALYRHIAEGNAPAAAIYTCEAVMGNLCALLEQNLAVVVSSSLSAKRYPQLLPMKGRRSAVSSQTEKMAFPRAVTSFAVSPTTNIKRKNISACWSGTVLSGEMKIWRKR